MMTSVTPPHPPLPVAERAPAEAYLDGVTDPRFYVTGPCVTGRPYVMVHKGDRTMVRVGSHVRFGDDVVLMIGGNHQIAWVPTFALREMFDLPGAYEGNPISRGDIVIGSDVTVGTGVRILSGVTVGHGAVIRPHAVVNKSVRPFAVVEGCPAREVRRRFDDAEVDRLLALAWWDWPAPRIDRTLVAPGGAMPPTAPRARRARAARALRRLASRLDPTPAHPLSDLPAALPVHPPEAFEMGVASFSPPVLHRDPGSPHRLSYGRFTSVAFDAEFVLDETDEPSARSAVALGLPPERWGRRGGDITVGNDVWITRGAKVLPGVTIGDGAVVAAYAVVTEDVRPYAIVAGNPAREVGRRFDDETVAALLAIAWWSWPEAVVLERADELCSSDVAGFIDRYRGDGTGGPPG